MNTKPPSPVRAVAPGPASLGLRPLAALPLWRSGSGFAFSLIEVMVTVGLLSFIILGLLAMFSQTQKAFRVSMTQADVLEAGRSVMDMLSREIEQAAPTRYPTVFMGNRPMFATNFFVEVTSDLDNLLVQNLPGSSSTPVLRSNYLDRLFFLTKVNQDWIGTGYRVVPDDSKGWVGTLYRFSITNDSRTGPFTNASGAFIANVGVTNRIADGIVHFRVRPFAAKGFPVLADPGARGYAVTRTNAFLPTAASGIFPYSPIEDAFAITDRRAPDFALGCYFVKDAIPAFVEVELGILEPQLLPRYRSIPAGLPAAREFLSDHVAQVHLFRQRIPLRNVDVSVYP